MITLLVGENSFEIDRELKKIAASFDGRAEKIDGSELELKQLPDLLMGGTLFAEKRLVIIKNLSENKSVWSGFSTWIARISDDIQLILVEPKLDKRTKTYKDLQKTADVREFKSWTERDVATAEKWAVGEAKKLGFSLDAKNARLLTMRVGVDQWALYHAMEKLAAVEEISPEVIEAIIEANPVENVFNLFEAALRSDGLKAKEMCVTLALSEDPYRLFGLMSGQAFQLAALAVSDKPSAEVAKDLGAHPFALSKLVPYAKKLGRNGARKVIAAFAEADEGMKTSAADPWLLIERALIKTANV
jgi:DNA polymerase III delta subunit